MTRRVARLYHILGFNGKPGSHRRTTLRQTTVIQILATIILGSGPAVGSCVAELPAGFERVVDRPRGSRDSILSRANHDTLYVGCEVRGVLSIAVHREHILEATVLSLETSGGMVIRRSTTCVEQQRFRYSVPTYLGIK